MCVCEYLDVCGVAAVRGAHVCMGVSSKIMMKSGVLWIKKKERTKGERRERYTKSLLLFGKKSGKGEKPPPPKCMGDYFFCFFCIISLPLYYISPYFRAGPICTFF